MSYYGFKPYVSVAERQKKAQDAAKKAQKKGAKYSPIQPYRGAIAKTFWGKAWCDNLEAYSDYQNRLPRGRTYVRNGSVIDLKIQAGQVQALVMGSSLYTVQVSVQSVLAPQWEAIGKDCSGSIDSLVELLQGKLSTAVMKCICAPQTGLFPSPKELSFDCSCPDWAGMCKHVAAVMYGVGARLDQQPDLLFALRGVDAKDLVGQAGSGLRSSGAGVAKTRVLDDTALADVFGFEMDEMEDQATALPAVKSQPKVQNNKKPVAAKKTTAKNAPAKRVTAKKAAAKNVPTKKATAKKASTIKETNKKTVASQKVLSKSLAKKAEPESVKRKRVAAQKVKRSKAGAA